MFGKQKSQGQKKPRLQIHEVTRENDMRYRGPLSFQHFQVLGWICIVVSQVVVMLKLGARIDTQVAADTADLLSTLQTIAGFSLPLLLIANFAQILDYSNGYRRQLIKNVCAAAALCGLFYLFFYRYFVGGFEAFLDDPSQAMPTVKSALDEVAKFGFIDFNLFIDLLLCTLVMLFLNYRPKHIFKGKLIIVFRLFALLPIAYEVCCMVLKIRAAEGLIQIPIWVYPLLTVKPPMTFVLFVALAIFVKARELRFRRHGKTHEEYQAFLHTRRNSWNFSVFLAIMMVVVSIVDFAVVMGFTLGEGVHSFMESVQTAQVEADVESAEGAAMIDADELAILLDGAANEAAAAADGAAIDADGTAEAAEAPDDTADAPQAPGKDVSSLSGAELEAAMNSYLESDEGNAALKRALSMALAVGFGGSMYLAYLAPLVLLFSYTRKPKYRLISLLIPVAGIILILGVYFEGTHRLLYILPIKKVNLEEIRQYAVIFMMMLE